MKSDIARWNSKYLDHQYSHTLEPDPMLLEMKSAFDGDGLALDLATGVGNNAVYLARLGYKTIAVDGSINGIKFGQRRARENSLNVGWFVADLDQYPLPHETFDAVIVVKYLNRRLVQAIKRTIKPNGLLFFSTFNHNFRVKKPSFPEDYVLKKGELGSWFAKWKCLSTNEGVETKALTSFWCGTKTC